MNKSEGSYLHLFLVPKTIITKSKADQFLCLSSSYCLDLKGGAEAAKEFREKALHRASGYSGDDRPQPLILWDDQKSPG